MPTFERGAIVRVPFPYVDKERAHFRPALVVSNPVGPGGALIWVLMITSAESPSWPGDVAIDHPAPRTGLPIASVVRTAKIAAIETSSATPLGRLPEAAWRQVETELKRAGLK